MNFKTLYLPDFSVPRRLRVLKSLLALAMLASLLVSWRLWAGERLLPHVPAFESLPVLSLLAEQIIFGTLLLLCVLIMLARKPGIFILLLLAGVVFMTLCDVNRMQPWMFQYGVLFFVIAFYNWRVDEPRTYTPVFSSVRICIAAFYLWDGIHKFNGAFVNETWPWMLSTFEPVMAHKALSFLSKAAIVIPAAEILAACSLFLPTMKRLGIPVLFFIHILNLICLGPLGKNFNPALWPWNASMMVIVYAAFAGKAESKYYGIAHTVQYKPFFAAIASVIIVPLLSHASLPVPGKLTDFNPHPHSAVTIELSEQAVAQLPLYLSGFVEEDGNGKVLHIEKWALHELNTPLNGAGLVYAKLAAELKRITCCPQHVNLRFKEKSSTVASL